MYEGTERRQLPEDVSRDRQEAALLLDMGKALTSSLDFEQVLRTIAKKITEVLNPEHWALLLMEPGTSHLYYRIATGKGADTLREVRIPVGQGIAGWVAEQGVPAAMLDVCRDVRFSPLDESTDQGIHSMLAAPLRADGETLGVIEIMACRKPAEFSARDAARLEALGDYSAIAIANARRVERVHALSITDDCTGLHNARHLQTILEAEIYRSARYEFDFSLVFFDLDHFKKVNDLHGHLAGSQLLAEIAQTVRKSLRLIDYAFRYGGDEFVLLLPQTTKEGAGMVARRIHRLIGQRAWLAERKLNLCITACFGICAFPGDSEKKESLLRLADEAMYLVKNSTRNGIAAAGCGVLPHSLAHSA
jgi:diguanylate cyclase (GGDEF)-like protein